MKNIVSAVFDSHREAEQAITQLRSVGVPDSAISIVAQNAEKVDAGDANRQSIDDHDNKGSGVAKGLTVGAGVGALFGLAALAIPGIGPFVTAGALAEVLGTAGGAVAAGAIVGGTAGGLAGALMNYGISREDAEFYERRIHEGGVFVAVDTRGDANNELVVREALQRAGGKTSAYMA